jgi:hypothetical protein
VKWKPRPRRFDALAQTKKSANEVLGLTSAIFFTKLAIFLWETCLASAKNLLSKYFQTQSFVRSNCSPENLNALKVQREETMSKSTPRSKARSRFIIITSSISTVALICVCVVLASISLSTATAYNQNFDAMGTAATASLPVDFKVDKPVTVRTVGSYASALTATSLAGGPNLSTTASNGIYNFGSGTTTTGSDRAVGFLSSGTATSSGNLYGQFVNSTGSGLNGLTISYDVEKYRNGLNPAGFRIQLFYSTDGVNWTNAGNSFLTSFAANTDNTGCSPAPCSSTSISGQNLNVSIPNGTNFYLAWNYSVASGTTTTNAQALAIDNISVLGIAGGGPTNPSGSGSAGTNPVVAGNSTMLTVTVTPGTNPASTGLTVSGNLTSVGGSASQQFFDDGTHGDVTAGDNIFSFQATVSTGTIAGGKTISTTISDAQARSGSANISLTVTAASTSPTGVGSAIPGSVLPGNSSLLKVTVSPGTGPTSTSLAVVGNLSSIGGSSSQQFFDDGTHGDATIGDNVFSFQATVSVGTTVGAKSLPANISDAQSRTGTTSISLTVQSPPPPSTIKISQVYGGGGNSGSTYKNDFIEIYNQGPTTIDVSDWSVQEASATASTWAVTNLCAVAPCTIAPGHYYLVQESVGAGGTTPLPAPDASGGITMSATAAKVALVNTTVALTGNCPTGGGIADFVGYGGANCSETSPTTTLSNTLAAVRRGNGCIDTDNNAGDFLTIGPIPRNSSSPVNSCGGDPTQPSGLGIASPSSLESGNTLLTVTVTPATTPPSTGLGVVGDLTSIGGPASQQFYDDGSHGDVVAGDNIFSYDAAVVGFIPTGVKNIVTTITDAQSRTATAPITMSVTSPTCGVERWSVKTGTDPDAGLVDLNNAVPTTIQALGALTPPLDPPGPPLNSRIAPAETTVYVINALMTLYKKETDVDYHVVIQDETGHTMIVELPCACCVGPSSPFGAAIAAARAKFDARFTATDNFQTANVPVQVKGVGFFDFIHGQTGVAPNGIELHPVLELNFTANTSTTLMSNTNPSQYGQSVAITATVSNGGATTPTGNITFFDGGNPVDSATLDVNGKATFNTSSLSVGSHSITASYGGDSTSAPSTSTVLLQVVNKADQTITFPALSGKTYGDPPFNVSATASSGLPVSFQIQSGPATISGNTVTITGGGDVVVLATQAGDGNYNPAPDAQQSFTVARATATISVSGYTGVYDGNAHGATGSATGINQEDLTSLLSLGASFTDAPGGTAHWSFAGNANYEPANGDVAITINKATPVITWSNPADIVYGTALGAIQLNATANVAGSFNYTPPSGTVLNAGAGHSLLGSFSPADSTNYNSTSKTVMINVLLANPVFSNLSSPTIGCTAAITNLSGKISFGSFVPTGNVSITFDAVTQNAAIQPDGSFSASFATGSLTPANSPLPINYSYGGDGNFNPASGAGTLVIVDTVLPTITLNGNSISFWPPNHSYHTVGVADLVAGASDSCDTSVNINNVVIASVSSDEGNSSSGDILIAGDCKSVQLRAERDGNGDGRVYTITFRVRDAVGNSTFATAQVTIAHDQGHPNAINSGPAYTVNSNCP